MSEDKIYVYNPNMPDTILAEQVNFTTMTEHNCLASMEKIKSVLIYCDSGNKWLLSSNCCASIVDPIKCSKMMSENINDKFM